MQNKKTLLKQLKSAASTSVIDNTRTITTTTITANTATTTATTSTTTLPLPQLLLLVILQFFSSINIVWNCR